MSEQGTGSEATISVEAELDTLREGVDDPTVLKAQLAKEANARRQLTARAIKAEEERKEERLKRLEAEKLLAASTTTTTPNTSTATEPASTLNDEVVDLRLDGYSKKEVEWIMANGGRKSLEDPNSLVSIAIKAQREQQKAEQAASAVGDTSGLTEIERKYTPEQLANMPLKELEKILPRVS